MFMNHVRSSSIRLKIVGVALTLLLATVALLTMLWYHSSQTNAQKYLHAMADNYAQQANSSLNYILNDTYHMLTLITLNEEAIINPIQAISRMKLDDSGQLDMKYLENQRKIMDFLKTMNGYKYYIVGIQIFSVDGHSFQTSSLFRDNVSLFQDLQRLDKGEISTSMEMLEPMKVEGTWTKLHSEYVIPAVRAILNANHETIGYTLLFFDYSLFEQMFSDNLPQGSLCRIIDTEDRIVFSNDTHLGQFPDPSPQYIVQTLQFDNVDWTLEIALPTDSIVGTINRTLRTTLYWILFIIVGSAVTMFLLLSNITNRISQLNQAMIQVSHGQLLPMVEPTKHDEIAHMQQTFNDMVRDINRLMERQARDEREKAEQQFRLLQAQINPHFLSNVLGTISWMAHKQHADNIAPIADSMNSLLRSVLKNDQTMIPLRDELEQVKNYLDIMLCSGNYDFSVDIDVPDTVQDMPVLKFILQPIVENSLLHGFSRQDLMKDQKISITGRINNTDLDIRVWDNGIGMTEKEIQSLFQEDKKKHIGFSGVGVSNVQKRIKLEYGDGYGLKYASKPDQYTEAWFHLKVVHT